MSYVGLLETVQDSALAHLVSKSDHLVGAGLQVLHLVGIVLLLAALVLLSLRLVGLALAETPLDLVVGEARRFFRIGLVLAVASGALMFVATAKLYGAKWIFGVKMGLFVAALLLHALLLSRLARQPAPSPWAARGAVGLSLLLWTGVGFAGRLIGFV